MEVNYFDIGIALSLCYGLYRGALKGLIFQLTTLFALVAGIAGSVLFSQNVLPYLTPFVENEKVASFLAYLVAFLFIILLVHLTGKIVEKVVKLIALGMINRLLGALFGFSKFLLITGAISYGLLHLNNSLQFIPQSQLETSYLLPLAAQSFGWVFDVFKGWLSTYT